MASPLFETAEIRILSESQQFVAVGLARLGFEDFYVLFGANADDLKAAIARQFSTATELGSGLATIEFGQPTGIACAYPRDEMMDRQGVAIKLLLEVAPNRQSTFQSLRTFSGRFPPPAPGGLYVARIGVQADRRKHGIAGSLLLKLERDARDFPHSHIQLHVRRDNLAGRAFYSKHGYIECDGGAISPDCYLLLYKKL